MRLSIASHVGRVRRRNEDHLCIWESRRKRGVALVAVADGMGGHQAGEIASALALETIRTNVRRAYSHAAAAENGGGSVDGRSLLLEGISSANRRVFNRAGKSSRLNGMGTTVTALLIDGGDLFVGHIGDSRAYLFQGEKMTQLTVDHSLVGEMVLQGDLTEAEAMKHPQRHVLTRAIGVEREAAADAVRLTFEEGAIAVLATDGLTNLVSAQEIGEVIRNGYHDFPFLAHRLVELANRRGGHDNVTVIVAEPEAGGAG